MNPSKESGKYAVKAFQTLGFNLTESIYQPKLRMPRHTHEAASFSLVLQGAYTENYEQKSRFCQPSTIVIHPPQESHSVAFSDTKSRILNIKICFTTECNRRLTYFIYSNFPTSFEDSKVSIFIHTGNAICRRMFLDAWIIFIHAK